jgi:hypothetical protein
VHSSSGCDGYYYVISVPTPTTMTVMNAATSFTGAINGGTITFQNGDTANLAASNSFTATGTNTCYYGGGFGGSACGNQFILSGSSTTITRHRGQTFTISGSTGPAAGYVNTTKWIYTADNPYVPTGVAHFTARQIPNLSSTGGLASILPDGNLVKGRNIENGFDINPEYGFVSTIEGTLVRAAGFRMYGIAPNVQGWYEGGGFTGVLTTFYITQFDDQCPQTVQLFAHPHWENGQEVPTFWSNSTALHLLQRLRKYILQPAQTTPDYGRNIEAAVRSSSFGNILMTLNISDSPQTTTFELTPYLQSGQQILRYSATFRGIKVDVLSAGTNTDTVTQDPGAAVFYVFPTAFAGELASPTFQVRLADQPNATKAVVSYAYDRYWLDSSPAYTFDCGKGSCTLPVDPKIGTIYYRVRYLDPTGKVLATGDLAKL